jgi:tetratricopeptide (TPR) repeat protein
MRQFLIDRVKFSVRLGLTILILIGLGCIPVLGLNLAWADVSGTSLSAKDWLRSGVSAFQAGDYRSALSDFDQALVANPTYGAAFSNRCLTQIYLEHYSAAIEDCGQALQLNPTDTESYLNRGLAAYRLGQLEAAITDYNQLLQLKPHDFRAYYNRALAEAEQQAYREAIVDYGEAIRQVSPLSHGMLAEIHNDRGIAHLGLENWPQAIADFTQSIQFSGNDLKAYYNRGCAYHHQGNLTAALQDFDQVTQFAPDHAQAYLSRGLVEQQLGDRAAALADFEQAARFFRSQGATIAHRQTLNLIRQLMTVPSAIG